MALTDLGSIQAAVVESVSVTDSGMHWTTPERLEPGMTMVLVLIDLRRVALLTATIRWTIEYSLDEGQSWRSVGGGGLALAQSDYMVNGTVLMTKQGVVVRTGGSVRPLPRADLARLVRIAIGATEPVILGVTLVSW